MGSNVESLSYLIQGLLTSEQIGGGWLDQARKIIPPGSNQLTGFLCAGAEAVVNGLGGQLDPQVSSSYRRPADVGLTVFESLMWADRDDLAANFAKMADAVRSCAGAPYMSGELGELVITIDEAPKLGTAAFAFRFAPSKPSTTDPWVEQRMTMVLLSDPSQPVALVVSVGTVNLHSPPGYESTVLDPAEYTRIVNAAVDRILEGL